MSNEVVNAFRSRASAVVALFWIAMLGIQVMFAQAAGPTRHTDGKERARVALSHALPKLDGSHLKATVVEVHYGPSESSPIHSHSCAVIAYVIEGAVRSQVKGEPESIYKPGESFYEAPNAVHIVSANASPTEPATFIAYFVCDRDGSLSSDVPESAMSGGR